MNLVQFASLQEAPAAAYLADSAFIRKTLRMLRAAQPRTKKTHLQRQVFSIRIAPLVIILGKLQRSRR